MITLKPIPQAEASATDQIFLVEIDEALCKAYNTCSAVQPIASVTFQSGAITLLNGYAVVPIIATVVLNTPSNCHRGCCNTNVYVEQSKVSFLATTANNISITAGRTVITEPTNQKCGKAQSVKVQATILVSIS